MHQSHLFTANGYPDDVNSDIFDYRPVLFDKADSDRFLNVWIKTVPWNQRYQFVYGKRVITPRLSAWYGDANMDYSADGSGSPALPWTPELKEIKTKVEAISEIAFNGVLLNFYRDENDSVAWHSDRDGVPERSKYVASVSFGQARSFDLRKKNDFTKVFSVLLEHGSYLLMKGKFQDQWQHRIAKSTTVMGPRVNLTFRISKGKVDDSF